MFNIKYIKVDPSTFLMQFKQGEIKRKGLGLAFWYYAPTTSLVAIPTNSIDLPFMFKETTQDYQEVSVQGQLVYRIFEPERIALHMNFALNDSASSRDLSYRSDDHEKLRNRIAGLAQVQLRSAIETLNLRQAISSSQTLVKTLRADLIASEVLAALGIEIVDVAIMAIRPTPETARALEASVREQLLEQADVAIYRRRNASIDQERSVKENELNTELAVEAKQREIQLAQLKAERDLQEQRRDLQRDQIEADIAHETQRQELVSLSSQNKRKQADDKAYEIAATMESLSQIDVKVLEALSLSKLNPQQLLAQAIRELASGAERIGQLNISPDLLQSFAERVHYER